MCAKNVFEEAPPARFNLHGGIYGGTESKPVRQGTVDDCYVKCMVCGRRFHVVHPNHLERHGLTVEEYLSIFSDAKIYSERYLKSLKRNYWKGIGKRREKVCVSCGTLFTTYSSKKVRCDLCQRLHRLETKRLRERLRRRSGKGVKQVLGTRGQSVNLRILPNGKVAAAYWLERNSSIREVTVATEESNSRS